MDGTLVITGGLGFLGAQTVVELAKKISKTKFLIIDNLSNSSELTFSRIKKLVPVPEDLNFRKVDLRDFNQLEQTLISVECQPIRGIFHFAGLKSVDDSINQSLLYYENNVVGTLNLLKIMEKLKVPFLIFSSSATVYAPNNCFSPHSEVDEIGFPSSSPYGTTKIMIEQIIQDWVRSIKTFEIKVGILRYFNPVGADPSGLIGESRSSKSTNLMPILFSVLRGERSDLSVFGTDYQTRDGSAIRDYLHVVDLADAHVLTYQFLNSSRSKSIEIFNLGTEKGTTVLELIDRTQVLLEKKIPIRLVGRRQGDLPISIASSQRAKELLGWVPKFSLDEAIQHSWTYSLQPYSKF